MFYFRSDLKIKLAKSSVPGHRFVLTARADNWLANHQNWDDTTELSILVWQLIVSPVQCSCHLVCIQRLEPLGPRNWRSIIKLGLQRWTQSAKRPDRFPSQSFKGCRSVQTERTHSLLWTTTHSHGERVQLCRAIRQVRRNWCRNAQKVLRKPYE